MDKSHIEALAINIVSKANCSGENSNIPIVDLCPICGDDIYTLEQDIIKEFTLASCGYIFHQKCLEEYLVDGESSCPYDGCNRDIETYLSLELLNGEKTALMDIDDNGAEGSEILISSGDVAPEEQRVAYISSTDQKKRIRESSTKNHLTRRRKKLVGRKYHLC